MIPLASASATAWVTFSAPSLWRARVDVGAQRVLRDLQLSATCARLCPRLSRLSVSRSRGDSSVVGALDLVVDDPHRLLVDEMRRPSGCPWHCCRVKASQVRVVGQMVETRRSQTRRADPRSAPTSPGCRRLLHRLAHHLPRLRARPVERLPVDRMEAPLRPSTTGSIRGIVVLDVAADPFEAVGEGADLLADFRLPVW